MKKKLALYLVLLLSVVASLQAQRPRGHAVSRLQRASLKSNANPCVELLKDGLRDTYVTADQISSFSDSKHYFASDEFVRDYHDGKWKLNKIERKTTTEAGTAKETRPKNVSVFYYIRIN